METPPVQDLTSVAPQWADACETLTRQIGRHQRIASQPASDDHEYTPMLTRLTAGRMASTVEQLHQLADYGYPELRDLARRYQIVCEAQGAHFSSEALWMLTNFDTVVAESLAHAAPVFVTHELHEMAAHAADTLPEDINITPQLMFEPDLWLYFQEGVPIVTEAETVLLKAFLLHSEAHRHADAHGIHAVAYTEEDGALTPVDVFLIPFGADHWWSRVADPDDPWHADIAEKLSEQDYRRSQQVATSIAGCERFIVATLMLMGQKDFIVVDGHHRKVQRRLAHAQKTDRPVRVRIVLLRRRELVAGRAGALGVRRERRWWRRGHWRQFAPNRYTWVTGHVCGPAEAADPLVRNAYVGDR